MYTHTAEQLAAFKKPAREVFGGVNIYSGSTVSSVLLPDDTLMSIKIERSAPNGKFFGFAASQKMTIEVLGVLKLDKDTIIQPYFGAEDFEPILYPYFYVDSVIVEDTTNKTVITAYDIISKADKLTIGEVDITYPITFSEYMNKLYLAIGAGGLTLETTLGNTTYDEENGLVNVAGTESIRSILAAAAEFTGTICCCRETNKIEFLQLPQQVKDTLTTSDYFDFTNQPSLMLRGIIAVNGLEDNILVGRDSYYVQIIRENPFLTLRNDIATLLETTFDAVQTAIMFPHKLEYRGCPYYEFFDRLAVVDTTGLTHFIYGFNGSITYDGGFRASSEWSLEQIEETPKGNPTTLGSVLKNTVARIDKINNEIQLLSGLEDAVKEELAEIKLSTDDITMTVETTLKETNAELDSMSESINKISEKVSATMTSEQVSIAIQQELSTGVDSVQTKTGFTFDADGLTIDKSGSEMSTQITEDGMTVYRDVTPLLVADHVGVKATNLHATTFLLVGAHSRFENYGSDRTGCFWMNEEVSE